MRSKAPVRRLASGALACCLWAAVVCHAEGNAPATPEAAQSGPTVAQWIDMLQQVRQHALFQGLTLSYARATAQEVHYSPVSVAPRAGQDCVVVIGEGANPKMDRILKLASDPQATRVLMLTMAAHELGHCFRIRGKHLSKELWDQVRATAVGSPEREALEKTLSIEEAYADAYAMAYLQDAYPQQYAPVFEAMHTLRDDPYFATRFYQVEPLYQQLSTQGVDTRLPLQARVEALMRGAKF